MTRGVFLKSRGAGFLRALPILDDYVVRMCPSDLIGLDNRRTKGFRLLQKVLKEPVSDLVRIALHSLEKVTEIFIYP